MRGYLLSVVAIILLSTILNIVAPEGKMGKYINGIFAILVVFIMIQPLSYVKNYKNNTQNNLYLDSVKLNEELINNVNQLKINAKKESVENILLASGIVNSEVLLEFEKLNYEIIYKNVQINLKNAVINCNKPHIDIIEQARLNVANYMRLDISAVIVCE